MLSSQQPQITNTVLMVHPRDFTFNDQTAQDNEFQTKPSQSNSSILSSVNEEFLNSVSLLKAHNINVLVIDKNDDPSLSNDKTPDSIFPNNWLSTTSEGQLFTYPMCTPNRRLEKKLLPLIERTLKAEGYQYKGVIDIQGEEGQFLEGTGSMIFNRNKQNRSILAATSLRTHESLLKKYGDITKENIIQFNARSSNNMPFYHTNIILCIGEGFAVICSESIPDQSERKLVLDNLKESGLDIVEISYEQTEKYFCGNMLHLRSAKDPNERFIVLSERALKGLTQEQKDVLGKYGKFIALPLKLIEEIGGGSARCMLCEIFLTK